MPNLLPITFMVLAALALLLALLWLWLSVRGVLVHSDTLAPSSRVVSPERARLLAEKKAVLLALKDLEAELESGKLSKADFDELNAQYRARARGVLRDLDELLAPHRDAAKALLDDTGSARDAKGGKDPKASKAAQAPAKGEPDEAVAAAGLLCPACGAGNDTDALFCKKCGARMKSEAVV